MNRGRRILRESEEMLTQGFGFDNQREKSLEFETKHNIEVVKEHKLVETSSSWNRDKFEAIINEAIREKHEIPWIIFPRVDRLARNIEAAGYFHGLLRRNGLKIGFAQEDLTVDDETATMNVFMVFLHAFKADQDGKQIKSNLLGGRDKLATKVNEVPNGMVIWPFDYHTKRLYGKMTTGKPGINEDRKQWVRKWVQWLIDDGIGLCEIRDRMNDAKVLSPRASRGWKGTRGKWSLKGIRDILKNRQLLGEFSWKGKRYLEDESLRILSNEEFAAIQGILDHNIERRYYNATKYDYPPLRKLVFHHCGQLMYAWPCFKKPRYRCIVCRESVDATILWSEIKAELANGLSREDRLIPALQAQFDSKETAGTLEQEIKIKDSEILKWRCAKDDAFQMGMMLKNYPTEKVQQHIDEAQGHIERLGIEKASLEKQLATLRERTLNIEGIRRLIEIIAGNIEKFTKEQWQRLNEMLKLKVTVYSSNFYVVNVALPPVKHCAIEISLL